MPTMTDPIINHEEAAQLAAIKRDESNLARCYLDAVQRIAELEKDAQNVMAELDAMNANFQGMLKDRNGWRETARSLEKAATEARQAALEEAAQICEGLTMPNANSHWECGTLDCEAAIRAAMKNDA
jgi:hypothetical protein